MNALAQLRSLAVGFSGEPISVRRVASGSAFVARKAQSFASVKHPRAFVSVVLDGSKRVGFRGVQSVLRAGDVLVVPAGVEYTAHVSARTRVFIVELESGAAAAFARVHPGLCRSRELGAFEADRVHVLSAQEPTLLSFCHVASTLLAVPVRAAVLEHRIEDLVLSLSLQHVAAAERPAVNTDPVLATRMLVRSDPALPWSVQEVARHFAMSPATLRRRLAREGTSLRDLRLEERMSAAPALLARRGSSVADVAAQCGYASPSKFARQFRKRFGHAPRDSSA